MIRSMWCSLGEHEAEEDKFYKRSDRGGFQSGCIDCRREYNHQHYQNNKKEYVEKAARNRQKTVVWLASLKSGKSCSRCGHTGHPMAMHWHHKHGKEFGLSNAGRRYGRSRILKEIAKCDLLCADCHAEETWGPMPLGSDG